MLRIASLRQMMPSKDGGFIATIQQGFQGAFAFQISLFFSHMLSKSTQFAFH